MSLPAEGLDHEAPALPIGGAALVRLGEAPPLGALSSVFQTESLDLVTMDPSAIYGPAPVPRPVLIVWMPVSSPEELLRAIVAWRDRSEKVHPVALLGCAPERAREKSAGLGRRLRRFRQAVVSPRECNSSSSAGASRRVIGSDCQRSLADQHLSLDLGAYALWIGGRSVRLTPTEMQLMRTPSPPTGARSRARSCSMRCGAVTIWRWACALSTTSSGGRRKAGDSQIIVTVRGQAFD